MEEVFSLQALRVLLVDSTYPCIGSGKAPSPYEGEAEIRRSDVGCAHLSAYSLQSPAPFSSARLLACWAEYYTNARAARRWSTGAGLNLKRSHGRARNGTQIYMNKNSFDFTGGSIKRRALMHSGGGIRWLSIPERMGFHSRLQPHPYRVRRRSRHSRYVF